MKGGNDSKGEGWLR